MGEPNARIAGAVLSETTRRLHRTLLDGLLATGAVPSPDALTRTVGIGRDALSERLEELVAADYAARDETGRLTCLYPVSAVPTPHVVLIDGQRRFAMCAIDALGMPVMLDRGLTIQGQCAHCRRPLELNVCLGAITLAKPPETIVVAHRDESQPAAAACCPFTVFACCPEHGRELVERTPGTCMLSLAEALVHAEALFGDFVRAAVLPARRPRWGALPHTRAGVYTTNDAGAGLA